MNTTARDAIATAAAANGWQAHISDYGSSVYSRLINGVAEIVEVSYSTRGALVIAEYVHGGTHLILNARTSGKRETVLSWLSAPAEAPSHHWQDCHDKDCDDTHYGDEAPAEPTALAINNAAIANGWESRHFVEDNMSAFKRGQTIVTVGYTKSGKVDYASTGVLGDFDSLSVAINPGEAVIAWLTTPQQVVVYGYEWRDATYGNPYQTYVIYADGVEVARSENPEYGYGDHYVTLAWEAVQEKFLGVQATMQRWADDNGVTLTTRKFSVKRKRDLIDMLGTLPTN